MNQRIKDILEMDRPREKLLNKGAESLSDQELMAVLLGKGTAGMNVMQLAAKLVKIIDEKGSGIQIHDLKLLHGIGSAKAASVLAALEFARRRIKPEGSKIIEPADLLPHLRHYSDRKQEHFLCASINGAGEIINIRVISIGLVDRAPVHPREVFADALSDRASAIIVAHNHPAGELKPSSADIETTNQLKAAGNILGIPLLDHIIFNRESYFSFIESGCL
ncbi:MAG: DNA repair protein RadC [Candidatus Riflebacteria bacterium]